MDDSAALAGTWQIVKAELAGEIMPAFVAERMEVELRDGAYAVSFAGAVCDRGTFSVDTTCDPKAMWLSGIEGSNAGRTIPTIYQLVGDRLRVCYGLDGRLPTEFTTAGDQKLYLATYRRKKG